MPGKPRIGYIGIGLMGLPMVKRLLSLGYAASACDIVAERVAAAAASGAKAASSPAEASAGAELVLLNLPTTESVERAMFASNFPVDGLCASFDEIYSGFREIVRDFPLLEQRRLFHDNAVRIYAME